MSDDWEMVVRVRIRNCIERDLPDAREILADCIRDDGGVWSVLSGWCEPEDMEILSLEPAGAHDEMQGNEVRRLAQAAQAVVDRWDTPLWKDVPATAEYIARLRAALSAQRGGE